ncbi:MAG: YitT family protein, partial [Lachnospiraceae bacterium]
MFKNIKLKSCVIALFASAFLAFGLYQVHSFAGVTEGGVLGMTLLLQNWFGISPAVSGFVMNLLCYLLGWKLLGREFILYSIVST